MEGATIQGRATLEGRVRVRERAMCVICRGEGRR